ncbi:cholinesterase 2 [Condylostylus longicornis]|uniref:cholinesterase 2 n=1 Tax=Condylostylus longicornis TaxID=2530218 RepID=UPI00244DF917|nr:cholinesterase 2 [Condylostylus longicornis]
MSFDWAKHRISGLDLASEGIVVVHVQYRTNIFGWITMNSSEFPGNFGLSDQTLALLWIQKHIIKFGGNPDNVTIMGHGTSGVTCALLHLISPKTDELFSKMILMSGSSLNFRVTSDKRASEIMIIKLGCYDTKTSIVLRCLRSKSVSDLLNAFDIVYQHGNYSIIPGPVLDTFRIEKHQYVPKNLDDVLKSGEYRKIPIIIGICSNEGAFIRDYWIDLAREGFESLRSYINFTTLPFILRKYLFLEGENNQVIKALNWRYFQMVNPRHPSYLLNSMQRLISEAEFEAPFYNTIELMARSIHQYTSPADAADLYVYVYQNSNSMDLRGKINLFGGASHSSDLPLLFGPSLFQQIARRRFTQSEDKICRKLRQFFRNPTPGRIYDAWMTYTVTKKYIKILGDMMPTAQTNEDFSMTFLEKNFAEIEEMLHKDTGNLEPSPTSREISNPYDLNKIDTKQRVKSTYVINRQDYEYFSRLKKVYSFWNVLLPSIYQSNNYQNNNIDTTSINDRNGKNIIIGEAEILEANKYKHAFFWMLGLVCILLASLGICTYVLRRDHPDWAAEL